MPPRPREVVAAVLTPPPSGQDTSQQPPINLGGEAETYVSAEAETYIPSVSSADAALETKAAHLTDQLTSTPLPALDTAPFTHIAVSPRRQTGGVPKEGPLEVGQAFGSRYHIIKVLGVGGMGAVYQAWDAELGVSVAVKVIRPEIAADPRAGADIERRFKRELLLARQVTHRNVVRIHDLGEIDGIKYITMPYVEGSDLATILKGETKLTVPRVMRLARGVVSGLVAAHEAGVVHRDLKPANIMVGADDDPLIMDFGIARSTSRDSQGSAPVSALPPTLSRSVALLAGSTQAGAIIGTVEYMAPEQVKGQPVDQRADIYAFGLILYDMLVGGRRSERAESAIAELQRRMQSAPPSPRSVNPEVPEAVDAIITRCLEPDPEKRFQTTVELRAAFERLDDDGRPLPIIRRVTRRTMIAATVAVALLLGGTFYTAKWLSAPPIEHEPVTVLIADFQNTTGDPAFDNTLGQTLKRALEGASFITAFDRTRIGTFGVRAPDKFDEVAARELAVKQGLRYVVAGSIVPRGNGYEITVQSIEPKTGNVHAVAERRASSKDQVLDAVSRLATSVRKTFGDETSTSAQLLALTTLSTTSLEVSSLYAAALEAQSKGKNEEAMKSVSKALELDPKFGLGYHAMAILSRNLGRFDDADKYLSEALRYLDSMTERERYMTRGFYYGRTGDYHQCVKEYGELVDRYPGDLVARAQRATCLYKLRNIRGAVDEMRQVVNVLPSHTGFRRNLATLLSVAGDFSGAEQELRGLQELATDVRATRILGVAQLGQGRVREAAETYQKLSTMGALGASWAAIASGDLAVYEGRFSDAVQILEAGAAADLRANNRDRAAMKLAAVAHAQLTRGQSRAAASAAERALQISTATPIRFLSARILAETGAVKRAQTVAEEFKSQLGVEQQAFGKIIEGGIALKNGEPRQAIKLLGEANEVLDTWLGHFDLGRAYFALGAYPQADSEFDRCIQRHGEALYLLDDDPTYAYFPLVHYYKGRVREEMKTAGFADAYREYLKIRGQSTEDPLAPEVRGRIGS